MNNFDRPVTFLGIEWTSVDKNLELRDAYNLVGMINKINKFLFDFPKIFLTDE